MAAKTNQIVLKNSIMVPSSNQSIQITDNNSTYNYPIQTTQKHQPTLNTTITSSHSQVRVSFNNGQSIKISNNLTNDDSRNQFVMRQNSLINVENRSNSVQYSSLSQSPQPFVKFEKSLENRGTLNFAQSNIGHYSNSGTGTGIAHQNGIANQGYHVIQRRPNAANFINPHHDFTQYEVKLGNQVIRPQPKQLPLTKNQFSSTK